MGLPERFEIWEAELGFGKHEFQKWGRRPVLIFSDTLFNKYHDTALVIPFKSYRGTLRGDQILVEGGGLLRPSTLAPGMLLPVHQNDLIRRVGFLPEPCRDRLELSVMKCLGLGDRIPWDETAVVEAATGKLRGAR